MIFEYKRYILILFFICNIFSLFNENNKHILSKSQRITLEIIKKIENEWLIEQYPNFLLSVIMKENGWNIWKNRFEKKILESLNNGNSNFIAGFMGSSVTAGHDSLYTQSFPVLIEEIMNSATSSLNVKFESKNLAIGNNPCIPYDLCPLTFAGSDVDMVHWEQSYNCGFGDQQMKLEQFVRQSIAIPSSPLIIFSDSATPNWKQQECPDTSINITLSSSEKKLYELSQQPNGIKKISTNINNEIYHKFGFMNKVVQRYGETVGIQFWDHTHYENYKCRGPYIPSWGIGCVKWHPSVSGHKVRAAHHAYFWLHIWLDAIDSIQNRIKTTNSIITSFQDVTKEYDNYQIKIQHLLDSSNIFPTNIVDRIQCFTDYEPHIERKYSLSNFVLKNPSSSKQWNHTIYENMMKSDIIVKANQRGYLDYKYVYYGNIYSDVLSIKIHVKKEGYLYLCEGPGFFGKLLNNFVHLWESNIEIYKTIISDSEYVEMKEFQFDINKGIRLGISHTKLDEICLQIVEEFIPGSFIITLKPVSDKSVSLSYVLVP